MGPSAAHSFWFWFSRSPRPLRPSVSPRSRPEDEEGASLSGEKVVLCRSTATVWSCPFQPEMVFIYIPGNADRGLAVSPRGREMAVRHKSAALIETLSWGCAQAACSCEHRGAGGLEERRGLLLASGMNRLRCSQGEEQRQKHRGKRGGRTRCGETQRDKGD